MGKIIEIEGLTKRYDDRIAVNNLNLSIEQGEVFGLLGPNGAGKSTTILMLLGLTEPDAGKASVCGMDPVQSPIQVKKRVGYLPEDVGFYSDLSGLDNLIYSARLNNLSADEARQRALVLLEKVGLDTEKDKKVGKYSRGMRQRLGLADVLIKNPEVIILDEPTLGIDPAGVKAFLQLITRLSKEEGITVLFSSHHLYQVQQVCDRVGIFVEGELLACGGISTLAKQLFPDESFVLEGEVVPSANGKDTQKSLDQVIKELRQIKGTREVKFDAHRFEIKAERDLATTVSEMLVKSGFALSYLNKKEYGLDDIYSRYFQ